jgi:hypothetical protein
MDNRVTDVNTHCHLGLDLQSNCKWGVYVGKIYKKACDRLKILRMLKYQVDRNVLINIYLSFIETSLSKAYLQLVYNFVHRLLHTKMYHRQRV